MMLKNQLKTSIFITDLINLKHELQAVIVTLILLGTYQLITQEG